MDEVAYFGSLPVIKTYEFVNGQQKFIGKPTF